MNLAFKTLAVLAAGTLYSAASAQNQPITGVWVSDMNGYEMILELGADGTGSLDGAPFRWSASQNILITQDEDGTFQYAYALADHSLILTDEQGYSISFAQKGTVQTQPTPQQVTVPATPSDQSGLIGRWQSSEGTIHFKSDSYVQYGATRYQYAITSPGVVTITGSDGSVPLSYTVTSDQLEISINGQKQLYRRVAATETSTGTSSEELVGRWCYMSNVYAQNGGSMTNECFTLNADGTYTYYRESSSSNAYGGYASQNSDQGTWKVSGNELHVQSATNGAVTYSFQKQNHPKNNDPMILLEGRAFVTTYQKAPWPE